MISSLRWHLLFLLAAGLLVAEPLRAQDPAMVPADLAYTQGTIAKNHLVNSVSLRVGENKYVRYRCDRYSDVVRITAEDGTQYAQATGKPWLRSKDWGKTGSKVTADAARKLDTEVNITKAPFAEFSTHDPSQGGLVWKSVGERQEADTAWFTFEQSRENPRPGGFYPRLTFVRYKDGKDGQLLLSFFTAQMHSSAEFPSEHPLIPLEIKFDYLIALPAGTKIEVVPAKPSRQDGT